MNGLTIFQKIGLAIDQRYIKKAGAEPVSGSKYNVLLVCFHPYHGQTSLKLAGEVVINPADQVGELHFSNYRVAELGKEKSSRTMEWRLLEILKEEFAALAKACSSGEIAPEMKAFYGVNVLVAGAKRLGFTLVPIPKGWNRWWLGFWETILRIVFYSYKTKKKTSFQKTKDPFEVWITREELLKRYLPKDK